ncbi:MAG: metallophosphoesterase [Candidatus Micrarchaeia archaeon]
MNFISGEPAVKLGDVLAVADLHLGVEKEFAAKGVDLGKKFLVAAQKINSLMNYSKTSNLVVLGDLKHETMQSSEEQQEIIGGFLDALDCKRLVLCKGNHDENLADFPAINVIQEQGFVLDAEKKKYGLFHGHVLPSRELYDAHYLLFAHVHPQLEFTDSYGAKSALQSWVLGNLKYEDKERAPQGQKALILPAFSKLCKSFSVNALPSEKLPGALVQTGVFDLEDSQALLLDGKKIGKIKDLRFETRQRL